MKNKFYDVIIVGAGPSGTSCAYNIKRFNPQISVLLIDKAGFPRYKPCGGGVSPEVANYFDFDLSEAINFDCKSVVMVANGQHIESNEHNLWLVRREVFDNFLLEKAKEKGIDSIFACEVLDIKQNLDYATVETTTGIYKTGIVVLAEGSRGKLAKKLGISPKNSVLAAIEYEHYTLDNLDGKLYIDFDYNDSGYAWNFPKSDGLSLGIGGFLKGQEKGNVGLPKKLENYVKQFDVDKFDKQHFHGHPIQLYSGRSKLVHDRVLLIGEIAGCVDPLTAEGIRPAIKSGYLAAKVIANMGGNTKSLKQYDKLFHNEIGKDMQYARIMSFFLNRYLAKILPMVSTPSGVNGFMMVFSGKSSYREKVNFRRILRMIKRVVVG